MVRYLVNKYNLETFPYFSLFSNIKICVCQHSGLFRCSWSSLHLPQTHVWSLCHWYSCQHILWYARLSDSQVCVMNIAVSYLQTNKISFYSHEKKKRYLAQFHSHSNHLYQHPGHNHVYNNPGMNMSNYSNCCIDNYRDQIYACSHWTGNR